MDSAEYIKVPQSLILEKLAGIYVSVYEIDLVNDTFNEYSTKMFIDELVNDDSSARKMMRKVMSSNVVPEQRESEAEFSNLDTVSERLKGKDRIVFEFLGTHVGWCKEQFINLIQDEAGNPVRVIHTVEVIEEQKKKEETLIRMTLFDKLTGLLNRKAYEDNVAAYNNIPREEDFTLIAADINGLKIVNDTLGHEAGDELIRGAASCLREALGVYGRVFRVGGDEFEAIIFTSEKALESIISDLENKVYEWRGKLVDSLSISVGYARKPANKNQVLFCRFSDLFSFILTS